MPTIVDPPSGWKYGFPKRLPDLADKPDFDLKEWLVENGYPQEEIDSLGRHFYCRFWEHEG